MDAECDFTDPDDISSVSLDVQIKIVSWFLYQEGSVLPEIVSRLSSVYGSETVDIISVSLFLQGLDSDRAPLAAHKEEVAAENSSNCNDEYLDGSNPEAEYVVLDDLPDSKEDVRRLEQQLKEPSSSVKKGFKSRKKVACNYCDKVHVNKYTLDLHIITNHPKNSKSCEYCGTTYGLTELLNKHVRVKHDTAQRVEIQDAGGKENDGAPRFGWKCQHCDKVFRGKKAMETHAYVHIDVKIFDCDICGKKLRNPTTLEKHKANFHSESGELACSLCDHVSTSRVALKQHLGTHGFVCRTCCLVVQSAADLEDHTKSHTKTDKCDWCDKDFSTAAALRAHIKRIHLKENRFMCSKCDLMFSSRVEMKNHMMEAHNEDSRSLFVCDTCGKPYGSANKLRDHMLYDHQRIQKPYQCKVCPKRFASKPDQARHMERHSAMPNYSCQECQKKFYTKHDMLRHIKVVHQKFHAGSCDVCGRKFQTVGGREWTQHMNSHAGIKNLACPLCTKTFFTDESVKCHMISHFDTMYWSCSVCSKNFKRIKNVKYHLRHAHGIAEKEEIRKHCVRLRKAPTKAEIQKMAENSALQALPLEKEDTKSVFLDLRSNSVISSTYELTLS